MRKPMCGGSCNCKLLPLDLGHPPIPTCCALRPGAVPAAPKHAVDGLKRGPGVDGDCGLGRPSPGRKGSMLIGQRALRVGKLVGTGMGANANQPRACSI